MVNPVLEVKNLTKKFSSKGKNFTAVDNVSFSLGDGEILGLLGPNGAGKTTTIQMLLGVMDPSAGDIRYFDKPFEKHREEILKEVNFSSTYISLPWHFTTTEILDIFARLYEVPDSKKRINKLLEEFEISDKRNHQFFNLSAGEKTRLLLTKAFLNYPKVILLDEPTASLDPEIAVRVREFLKKEKREYNVSMLFTSHNMAEVEEMCDRVIILNHGKIIKEGVPADIAKEISDCRLQLMVTSNREKAISYIQNMGYTVKEDKTYITVTLSEKNVAHLLMEMANENIAYEEISIEKPDLEDFFLHIIGKGKHD